MEGFLVLADSGSTDQASGKVNLLGAGWSLTGPVVPPSVVAGFLRISWEDVKEDLTFHLRLVDESRNPVQVPQAEEKPRLVGFKGKIGFGDAQPTDGVGLQIPMNLSFSLSIPPLPLTPGNAYEWILEVGDAEVASVRFGVRPERATT